MPLFLSNKLGRALAHAGLGASMMLMALSLLPRSSHAGSPPTRQHTVKIGNLDIFYREAGPKDGPVVLLLHGFPSSSHMFRSLIPRLADKYRVIAPDYPGFGESAVPPLTSFPYTFEALTDIVDEFTKAVGASRYFLYMQDYGGPVGLRLAVKHPGRVRGLIIQNAVANVEGWNPDVVKSIAPFWQNRNAESEVPVRALLSAETTKFQYTHGATLSERLQPEAWVYDQAKLDRPRVADIQTEILFNYKDNVANYPTWQAYLQAKQPPLLIVWGRNDPFFTLKGVEYFKAQVPAAEVHLYDAGHFALETHAGEIAARMMGFLARHSKSK
ncbi:MAG: alpha/beta hydrolase [Candidatus Raskinella chloraquaticus]|uniref:Alpha/beta hydrolase n=2 Tax=Candidatus Raskinella chloraquaticus TaxID=1951219 RepID=A0A1W9HUF8_9HYPH|nr:MAG: alpha/beta hydrolase [Proteobacteria bacterium SG_bin8]